jgi:L-threonylcarbamoyladenylate synthase
VIRIELTENGHLPAAAAAAGEVVRRGGVVVVPTESTYGLGVDPANAAAVTRVFELKMRPPDRALPVVCCDWQQVRDLVRIPDACRVRLSRIWPAALTVIAPCQRRLPAATGDTLAVRIPGHPLLRALLYRVGPLTATSANRHGVPACIDVDGALASLAGDPDLVLDGGPLAGGRASTLVDLTLDPPRVIRVGPVAWEQVFDPESSTVMDR